MVRRSAELFGSFPSSTWAESFRRDIDGAHQVRIASGFTNLRGARDLVEQMDSGTKVDFLLGLAGCEGPDVVRELQKHSSITVRASLIFDFHWKAAAISCPANQVLYLGSANFTRKGFSGSGELMLRIAGSALDARVWEAFQTDFDAFFEEGTTLSNSDLIEALESVEHAGDVARGAQADFETALERIVNEAKARSVNEARRTWFLEWNDDFPPADDLVIEQTFGARPSDSWICGEVEEDEARRIRVRDIVLGYQRDETSFVLGEVARLKLVPLSRNRSVWIAELHLLVPPITGKEQAAEYSAIRRILGSRMGTDGGLAPELYDRVIAFLRQAGILPAKAH